MTPSGVADILQCAGKLDLEKMSMTDWRAYILEIEEFAKKLKPLVIKYALDTAEPSTFLFKMEKRE